MNFTNAEIASYDDNFEALSIIPGVDITPQIINMPIPDNSKAIAANNTSVMKTNVANKSPDWESFFKSLYSTNKCTFVNSVNDTNISIYLAESDAIQELCANSVADRVGFIGIKIVDVIKAVPINVLTDIISMVASAFKHISNRKVAGKVASNIVLHAIYLFVKESAMTNTKVGNTRFMIDNKLQFFVYPMIKFIFNVEQASA